MNSNKMPKKKIILCLAFLIVIASLTFYSIFKEISLNDIVKDIAKINPLYSLICLALVLLYFVFQGIYTKIIFKSLSTDVSLIKAIYYSIVEFFFSGITPSSTGGQPAQLFYMTKDGIPMRKSIIVLLLNTVFFKIFMMFFGLLILIFHHDVVFGNGTLFAVLFFTGYITDFLMILACYFLSFKPSVVRKFVNMYINFMKKIGSKKKLGDVDEIINKYQDEVDFVMNHKKDAFKGLVVTFIQRIFMFSITFVVFKAFNLTGYNFIELFMLQITVHMCVEFIPLPGGTGISEHLFNHLYIDIFGAGLASIGMVLTRIFTFYLPIGVIMLIIIIVTNTLYIKEESK